MVISLVGVYFDFKCFPLCAVGGRTALLQNPNGNNAPRGGLVRKVWGGEKPFPWLGSFHRLITLTL